MSEELKKAMKKLENEGFYIENQFDGFTSTIPDEYELNDKNGNMLMDHLSEAQVIQFSKIKTDAIINYSVAVLAEVVERAKQEDAPIYEGDEEVDQWVRLSDVEDAINNYLN